MEARSLAELRALARRLGLTGYSRLRKDELQRLLATHESRQQVAPPTPTNEANRMQGVLPGAASAGTEAVTATTNKEPKPQPAAAPTAPGPAPDAEQRVESAKFAFAPPGISVAEPVLGTGLAEDIERLPEIAAPLLSLLPQKPGVLHGYWVIPSGYATPSQTLRLRLAHLHDGDSAVLEELPLPATRGHWYFHVSEAVELGTLYLQLGYYADGGRFVSAIERGIARIPSLYASERTDRQWWVSDEQFRAMYLRAGGFARGTRFGWAASVSSPGGGAGERLAWPGGVSSRK